MNAQLLLLHSGNRAVRGRACPRIIGTRAARLARSLRGVLLLLGLLVGAPQAFAQTITEVNTDKARYGKTEAITLTASIDNYQSGLTLVVKYYQGSTVLSTQSITPTAAAVSWAWTPPNTDFQGYLVGLTLQNGAATPLSTASIGVDVSSDWKQYPRYGFLSEYGPKTDGEMDAVMRKLTRYHLNGLQFYDWMDKHHQPLAGTAANPSPTWNDLANRPTSLATIKGYIDRGHNNNINALFYSLLYGAYPTAAADGVDLNGWALYHHPGASHDDRWFNGGFPGNWEAQELEIMNPANAGWRTYFFNEIDKVYNAAGLHFDGWHIDQLGDWGAMYDANGQAAPPDQSFSPFISAAKNAHADKRLVMNAVDQYGQPGIAGAPVDFTYTEMWANHESYESIRSVVQDNEQMAPGKRTVLAAYVNHDRSNDNNSSFFNDASVLMADATIFAVGGAHIELGEHLLGNEYFPNTKLQMSAALQQAITAYYDFAVAYETLLRGPDRTFNNVTLAGAPNVQYWPPVQGKVATVGSTAGGKQVFQLLNYTQAQTLNWRDNDRVQPVPTPIANLSLSFPSSAAVAKIWTASPDFNNGLPQELAFSQNGGTVTLQLPQLKYWAMLVVETGTAPPPPAAPSLQVYFHKPADWATPFVHYWNTLPTGSSTTWPGNAMSAAPQAGPNWYSYTFPAGISSASLVFSNNGDNATKTADLTRDHLGYYYKENNSWSDTAPLTVYFKKPSAWATAYVHYWNQQPGGGSTTWPGLAMSPAPAVGAGWYSFTFPAGTTSASLVFDDNGDNATKTADLYRDKTGYYANGTWSDAPTAGRGPLATAGPGPVAGLELAQNAPNPFRQSTTFRFSLPAAGPVSLVVYDLRGQASATVLQGALAAGPHEVVLNGAALAPGVYVCRLTTAAGTATRKVLKLN